MPAACVPRCVPRKSSNQTTTLILQCFDIRAVLNETLALHDVQDVERFANRIAHDALGASLRAHERDDLIAYLVAELWRASLSYDSARASSFSTHAYQLGRRRVIDWLRQERGRTRWKFSSGQHERERPDILSLDAPDGDQLAGPLAGGEVECEIGRPAYLRLLDG